MVNWHRDECGKLQVLKMPEVLRESNNGEFPDGQMLKANVGEREVHVPAPSCMNADELESSLVYLDGLARRAANAE